MMLLLDIGNSRLKWRAHAGGRMVDSGSCASTPEALEQVRLPKADHALICSVVDPCRHALLTPHLPVASSWIAAEASAHGLVNHYQPPGALGGDRYAALVGAWRRAQARASAPEAQVVVMAGTALTADMLTATGEFMGGCIAPGADMMLNALHAGTGRVRLAGLDGDMPPLAAWPATTQDAVGQGIGLALAGVVQGMCSRLEKHSGREPHVCLSGGARAILRPYLRCAYEEVDELVLEGMTWIARDRGFDV